LLTHDAKTMPPHAWARVDAGLPMPGVCVVRKTLPIGRAIEEISFVVFCAAEDEWKNKVLFLPL
jgi:hypothetical protein